MIESKEAVPCPAPDSSAHFCPGLSFQKKLWPQGIPGESYAPFNWGPFFELYVNYKVVKFSQC